MIGQASIEVLADTSKFGQTLKQGVKDAARNLGKLGLASGAAFAGGVAVGTGKAIAEFTNFEQGISEVFTLLGSDAPQSTLDAVSDNAKDLSSTFGITLQDSIQGTYDAISAGVDTSSLESFTETAAEFAKAGATDFGTSVDLLTTATNAFGIDASEAGRVSDTLFAGIQAGKTNADQLAASLFQVAPIAATTGVSLEEVTAGLATLTAQGVPTAAAATQLKGAFAELAKDGTIASKNFTDATGQSFTDFTKNGGTFEEALQVLSDSAEGSGKSVVDLFGSIEAGQGILGLTGIQAENFSDNLGNIEGASGAAGDAADRMNATLQSSFDRIRQSANVALVNVGEQLRPAVAGIADFIEANLPSAIERVSSLVTSAVEVIGPAFSAALGVVQDLLGGFGEGGGLDGFGGILDQIGEAAATLGPVIADLAGSIGTLLGAQALATRQILAELLPVFLDLALVVLPPLAQVLGIVAEAAATVISQLDPSIIKGIAAGFAAFKIAGLVSSFAGLAATIGPAIASVGTFIAALNPVTIAIAALVGGFVLLYSRSERFRSIVGKVLTALEPLKDIFGELKSAFSELFAGNFGGFLDGLSDVGGSIAEAFSNLGQVLLPVLSDIGRLILDGLIAGFEAAGDFLPKVGVFLRDAFVAAVPVVVNVAKQIPGLLLDGLKAAASGAAAGLAAIGGLLAGLLFKGIEAAFNSLGLGKVFDVIVGAVEIGIGAVGKLIDGAQALWNTGALQLAFRLVSIQIGVAWKIISTVVKIGITVVGKLIDAAKAIWNTGILQDIFSRLASVITVAFKAVAAGVAGGVIIVGKLIEGARSLWDTGILQEAFDQASTAIGIAWDLIIGAIEIGVAAVRVIIDNIKKVWDTGILQTIWDGVSTAIEFAWDQISRTVQFGIDGVAAIIDGVQAVWDTGILQTIWDGVSTAIGFVWDGIVAAVETGIALVGGVIDGVQAVWNTGVLQTVFDTVVTGFETAWGLISGAVETGVGLIKTALGFFGIGDGGGISEDGPGGLSKAFDGVSGAFETAWGLIQTVIDDAIILITPIIDGFKTAIGAIGTVSTDVEDTIRTVWGAISTFFDETVGAIKENFETGFQEAADLITGIWEAFQTGIGITWDAIKGVFTEKIEAIKTAILPIFEGTTGAIEGVWEAFKTGIGIVLDTIKGVFTDKIGEIDTFARDTLGGLAGFLTGILGIDLGTPDTSGVQAAAGRVARAASDIEGSLSRAVAAVGRLSAIENQIPTRLDRLGESVPIQTRSGTPTRVFPFQPFNPNAGNRRFAFGGFVDRATEALIGEDGRELVLPLTKQGRLSSLVSQALNIPAFAEAVEAALPSSTVLPLTDALNVSGTGPVRRRAQPAASQTEPRRGNVDQSTNTTVYNFYGNEADETAREMIQRDQELARSLRVRT